MGKIIAVFTAVCLFALSIGTHLAPEHPAFWMASGSTSYIAVRAALGIILIGQAITRPPRKPWFRLVAGLLATAVLGWTLAETYNFHMMLADTLLFMSASAAIAIIALEVTAPQPVRRVHA